MRKKVLFAFLFTALLVPAVAAGQTVTVTGQVNVPPPPTVVVDVATPPPPTVVVAEPAPPPTVVYAEPAPQQQVVYAQPQPAYATVAAVPEMESARAVHQFQVGVGIPICGFGAFDLGDSTESGSACVSDEFLWLNIPVVYRYRISDYLAAGGGLMFNIQPFQGAHLPGILEESSRCSRYSPRRRVGARGGWRWWTARAGQVPGRRS